MLFLIGGELRERLYPPVIKEADWKTIEKLSGLPEKARHEIDDYIGYCRELRHDVTRQSGDYWFDKLSAVIHAEKSSKNVLDRMIANRRFFEALATGLDGQEQIPANELQLIRDWLKRLSAEKARLLDWYAKARQRVHHGRTGQRTGRTALFVFVRGINHLLLDYTKRPISTAKKSMEFLVQVCKIAFPDLVDRVRKEKESTEEDRAYRRVKKVVEQVLKEHNDNDHTEPMVGWQHLIPGWKPADHLDIDDKRVRVYFHKDGDNTEWRIKQKTPDAIGVIYPDEPFVSDEIASRRAKS